MELKHLRTLQAVVDQGSFQRAAEHLGYTQSTVTVQIQQLEASIGVPLFQKAGRRMVLTETGMAILPQVRAILAASDRLLGGSVSVTFRPVRGSISADILWFDRSIFYHGRSAYCSWNFFILFDRKPGICRGDRHSGVPSGLLQRQSGGAYISNSVWFRGGPVRP